MSSNPKGFRDLALSRKPPVPKEVLCVFSEDVFGVELARKLDLLYEADRRLNGSARDGTSYGGTFTYPTGASLYEADLMTSRLYLNPETMNIFFQYDIIPGLRDGLKDHDAYANATELLSAVREQLAKRQTRIDREAEAAESDTSESYDNEDEDEEEEEEEEEDSDAA